MKMTTTELEELLSLYKAAHTTPVIALSVADGLGGRDFASLAQKRFEAKWTEVCDKYGLPSDRYGFDSQTGEFVS